MISFYNGSDLYHESRTMIGSTHLELGFIRDLAVLAQGVCQSPPVGYVGDVAREMGILLAEFIPGIENARRGVDESAGRNDKTNSKTLG